MTAAPAGSPAQGWRRAVWAIVMLLGWLTFAHGALATTPVSTSSTALPSPSTSPSPSAIDIADAASPLKLDKQLRLLVDPSAKLDAAQALAAPGWRDVTPKMLNPGYSESAFWIQGVVDNPSHQPVTRWLSIGIVRLEDVRFYAMPTGTTQPTITWLAGHTVPLSRHPIRSETSVFPISLAPGESLTFAIRVQTRSSVSIVPQLWVPDDFRRIESRNAMVAMLLAGSMLTIALYTLVLGIARRDIVFTLLALTTLTQVAQDMAFQGFIYRYLLPQGRIHRPCAEPVLDAHGGCLQRHGRHLLGPQPSAALAVGLSRHDRDHGVHDRLGGVR